MRSPSLHLSRFPRPGAPPAPGGHTPGRGEAHRGTHPVASPRPGRPATPTSSPRPHGQSKASSHGSPCAAGSPPSPLGTRALYGGRGWLRFRGAYPPVPPECPPHSARQGALRAPTTKNSAPHEGRGELPPITVPAPSRRKTRSVTIIQALAVRQLPKLSLQYVPHLRPRSREQRIRRRTL
ncbi:hypothetical protein ES705_49842 [subsurface metagenome]